MRDTEITFSLENTTPELFAQWLEDYVQTTSVHCAYIEERWFVLRLHSPSYPITRPVTISIDAVELPSSAGTTSARRRSRRTSARQRLEGVITFDLEPLTLDRVRVTAWCAYPDAPDVMDFFRPLMIIIARRWPSAAKIIARRFPPDLPPTSPMKSLALVNTDLDHLEALLHRFAARFAESRPSVNSIAIEPVPRDVHPNGEPFTPWEAAGWHVGMTIIREVVPTAFEQLGVPKKVTYTETFYTTQPVYVYSLGSHLELVTPDAWMEREACALHREFIGGFVEELRRLGLVMPTQPHPEVATGTMQSAREDVAGKRGGRPGLDHDELIYRLAKAQQAEEARAADPRKRWRDIAEEVGWAYGNKQDGLALLRDARHRLRRLDPGDPLLEEITAWRRVKKTNKT
jgi:hypothetical protein